MFAVEQPCGEVALGVDELRPLLTAIGEHPSDSRLRALVLEADRDANGTVDLEEFMSACDVILKHEEKSVDQHAVEKAAAASRPVDASFVDDEAWTEMMDSFRTLDKDGDGYLSVSDLEGLLSTVGEALTAEEAEDIVREADLDGDGRVDMGEFATLLLDSTKTSKSWRIRSGFRCILVVGGPGCGKGTFCDRLVEEARVQHISSGDLLREEVENGTPLGKEVAAIMAKGELVSPATIMALLRRRMSGYPGQYVLLDGFPRSKQNAIDFDALCGSAELVIYLQCPDDVMVERILHRGLKSGRSDDNAETAQARLATFHASGQPTLEYLQETGVPIVELDATLTPEEVWRQFIDANTPVGRRID